MLVLAPNIEASFLCCQQMPRSLPHQSSVWGWDGNVFRNSYSVQVEICKNDRAFRETLNWRELCDALLTTFAASLEFPLRCSDKGIWAWGRRDAVPLCLRTEIWCWKYGNILSTVRMAIISRSCLHSANGKSISTRRPDRCCVSVTHSSLHCGVLGTRTLEELSRCLRRKMVSIMLHWKKQHWPRVSLFVGQRCKICIDLYFYACEPLLDSGTWQGYDPQTTEGCRAPSACLRGYERDCDRMW